MKKVVAINLNGKAFQIEEQGYDALQSYLQQAQKKLANDPERDDVLNDFEQAIAEKCAQYLKDGKTVVLTAEVEKIIQDMGPVEAPDDEQSEAGEPAAHKRLYLIREGAVLGGVCTGLGAYFNIDANVVRLLFIIFTFVSSGLGVVVYLLMMFFLPEAETPEERATAHGERYTANDLLERARSKYTELSSGKHWHDVSKAARQTTQPAFSRLGLALGKLVRLAIRLVLVVTTIVTASLAIAWIITLWSIVVSNRLWGYTIDPSFSRWLFGLWDSALFLMLILPVFSVWILALRSLHKDRAARTRRAMQYGAGIGWCVAIALFIAIPLCSKQVQNLTRWNNVSERRLNLGEQTICFDKDGGGPIHASDCRR